MALLVGVPTVESLLVEEWHREVCTDRFFDDDIYTIRCHRTRQQETMHIVTLYCDVKAEGGGGSLFGGGATDI
jgi:hypothetical protein